MLLCFFRLYSFHTGKFCWTARGQRTIPGVGFQHGIGKIRQSLPSRTRNLAFDIRPAWPLRRRRSPAIKETILKGEHTDWPDVDRIIAENDMILSKSPRASYTPTILIGRYLRAYISSVFERRPGCWMAVLHDEPCSVHVYTLHRSRLVSELSSSHLPTHSSAQQVFRERFTPLPVSTHWDSKTCQKSSCDTWLQRVSITVTRQKECVLHGTVLWFDGLLPLTSALLRRRFFDNPRPSVSLTVRLPFEGED